MRVAHIGNVANIAYLNVKFLRRLDIDAHLYYYDFDLCLAQPEWEEATMKGECEVLDQDWRNKMAIQTYHKQDWTHSISMVPNRRILQVRIPMADCSHPGLRGILGKWENRANRLLSIGKQYGVVTRALRKRGVDINLSPFDIMRYFDINRFREIAQSCDIVQAYGIEPIACLADFPRRPFIAYEFGTMRDIPFEDSVRGKLLTAAYQQAERVVITNPDVIAAANRLGVNNWVFIPHPVDEGKYTPGSSTIRRTLELKYGSDIKVIFAPARHDWSVKGNDRMIRGVARVMREERVPIVLVLTKWGEDVEKSRELILSEGIEDKVIWSPLLSKLKMIDYYRGSDVVMDQFVLGTFGLTTAEAMACGKPVVVYFKPALHEPCFPVMPPVVAALTEQEIGEQTSALVNNLAWRLAQGEKSRQWVCQHHGWEIVARKHIQLYREILLTQ